MRKNALPVMLCAVLFFVLLAIVHGCGGGSGTGPVMQNVTGDVGRSAAQVADPDCGMVVDSSVTLDDNMYCPDSSAIVIQRGASDIVIDCGETTRYQIYGSATGTPYAGILYQSDIPANNVTIKNCVISNYEMGIRLYPTASSTIANNELYDNGAVGPSHKGGMFIVGSNNVITKNNVHDNRTGGISLKGDGPFTITNNTLDNIQVTGITVEYLTTGTTVISGNTLSGIGTIRDFSHIAINVASTPNAEVTNNNISSSNIGVAVNTSDSVKVEGNTIQGSGMNSIRAVFSNNLSIKGNNITEGGGVSHGIVFWDITNTSVSENTVEGSIYGLHLYSRVDETKDNEIFHNNFRENQYGVYMSLLTTNNSIFHNNIFNNTVKNIYGASAYEVSKDEEGNYWGHTCPDPLFQAGVDSNILSVVDSYAYSFENAWLIGGTPGSCCTDADGDGYSLEGLACGTEPDCDDSDPAINPGADEIYGNDVDENCDGVLGTCTDADKDDFYVEGLVCGTEPDCDDNDYDINPNAIDLPGNDVDENCDGIVQWECSSATIHGQYVCDVRDDLNELVEKKDITCDQRKDLLIIAAQSECGQGSTGEKGWEKDIENCKNGGDHSAGENNPCSNGDNSDNGNDNGNGNGNGHGNGNGGDHGASNSNSGGNGGNSGNGNSHGNGNGH